MSKTVTFPLRFKILIVQLLVVTVVLSLITFTMANLFHRDKTAYIHDLTATVLQHTADQVNTLVTGYRQRLSLFSRVLAREETADRKRVLQDLFEEFGEFLLVTSSSPGREVSACDQAALAAAGLSREKLLAYRRLHPLPVQLRPGQAYLECVSLAPRAPTLILTQVEPDAEKSAPVTVSAWISLEKLLNLAGHSRLFETFVLDAQGRFLVHSDRSRLASTASGAWWERVQKGGPRGVTIEYEQQGVVMVGGFSRIPWGGLTIGVQLPKSAASLSSGLLLNHLLLVSLSLLGGAALLSLFWSHLLTRPIEALSRATRMVGQGKFEIQVKAESRDEIGALGKSFNSMAGELRNRESALKELFGQLVQAEKMAAFGALGAGIAHEVKNPLAGILGIAQLSVRQLESGHPLHHNLQIIEKETKRCKTIIENLLRFTRQERVPFREVEIVQVVNDAVAIVDHQLGMHRVTIEKEVETGLPGLQGDPNQLQQVLINLLLNAQQAMAGSGGMVRLSARRVEGGVEVRVYDTGPGITSAIESRIFDPFFTTKPAGQGTGLGLSVSYGIVKDHGGQIRMESSEGKGSTFIITLPAAERGTAA